MITIVGGGLAGLSLGIALRKRGVPVTLHEAGIYPRHRVCGEFISGVSPDTFDSLGIGDLFDDARRHRSTAWFFRARRISLHSTPERPGNLPIHPGRKTFKEIHGAWRNSLRTLAPETSKGRRARLVCRENAGKRPLDRAEVSCAWLELDADLEMHLASNGYVGLAKVERGKVNVCGLFRLEPSLR